MSSFHNLLKAPENQSFSGVSRRCKMGTMSEICYIGKNKIDLMHISTDIFKM